MLYHIYSGHLFFTSLTALIVVAVLDMRGVVDRFPILVSLARISALASIALAAFSGTPVAIWLAVPAGGVAIGYVFAGIGMPGHRRVALGIPTILLAMACVALEVPYHRLHPGIERPARLIVVGDSLSSGGFGEGEPWPSKLASEIGAELVNLSRPGDTVRFAIEGQLPDIPTPLDGDLVMFEIGGNDMLEGAATRRFEAELADLTESASQSGRTVAMFELPLLPGRWGYGAAQRRIARRSGVVLVPKRVLARVLLASDTTFDGLHLTDRGHDALAREVADWAGW